LNIIVAPDAPSLGPYSHAIAANGFVFTAGMGGIDSESGEVVSDDVVEQAERALTNTEAILAAAGADLSQVVKVIQYLTDVADYGRVNEVYARRFGDHRPARTCVVVAGLPARERVKFEAIAHIPSEAT
jgi:2-iminobutanoate/2-iminopropanoate deaminase